MNILFYVLVIIMSAYSLFFKANLTLRVLTWVSIITLTIVSYGWQTLNQ
jgi:hypothetical protein